MGNQWSSNLCADLFEAARTISYVETISNKADTLHKYIKFSDSKSLKKAYEEQVRKILKKLKIKNVKLAIDGKKDLYYGKNGNINVRGISPEHGANEVWEYIVISIVYPEKIPIMAIPYSMGSDLATICIELLEYAKSLPISIKEVLFDRGFYNSHLIDYLESKNNKDPLPYLILVPQNKAVKKYIYATTKKIGVFKHQMLYQKKKSSWKPYTTIVVCKDAGFNKKGKPYDMIFATNLKPTIRLIKKYKKRWNIETGFRIMEEGKIRTKSNNPLVRFFFFLLRALMIIIWLLNRMLRNPIQTYKSFLSAVDKQLREYEVERPPPIPLLE